MLTSYFGNIRNLNLDTVIPVGIARMPPAAFSGPVYIPLAPPLDLIKTYKAGGMSWDEYTEIYNRRVIAVSNPETVVRQIRLLCHGLTPVLCCYERPEDDCHRHIVAAWLIAHGFTCHETGAPEKIVKPEPVRQLTLF